MPIRDCLIEPMRGGSYYSVNVLCIDIVQFKFELQIQVGHLLFGQLLPSVLDQEKSRRLCMFWVRDDPFGKPLHILSPGPAACGGH